MKPKSFYILALEKITRAKNKLIVILLSLILKITKRRGYRIAYQVPFGINSLRSFVNNMWSRSNEEEYDYDLVFIMNKGDLNWILGAICREIAIYFPGNYLLFSAEYYNKDKDLFTYTPVLPELPKAKHYFFAHYSYFILCLRMYPSLKFKNTFVYYTHPKEIKGIMHDEEFVYVMNHATKIIGMCSQFAHRLVDYGIKSEKVTYVLGAADPELFQFHERTGHGKVGFCTAYYPRKDPERICNIIKNMPHREFILIGRGWEGYEKFAEMEQLSNFSYVHIPYSEYPKYYAQMDVFVSPAKLEGGPIPLVEAMMSNVVPVASNTGFAPDLISHGENGFIFDVESPSEMICELIDQAFQLTTNIRQTVEHLSWENYSLEVQKIINS